MKPQCWDAICYLAGTTRGSDGTVTLSQSDCRELTAYVIQLTAPDPSRSREVNDYGAQEEMKPDHLCCADLCGGERVDGSKLCSMHKLYADEREAKRLKQETEALALSDARSLVVRWEDDAERYGNTIKASCASELRAVLHMTTLLSLARGQNEPHPVSD